MASVIIEEGNVKIDGADTEGCFFTINSDKVICAYFKDGEGGEASDTVILVDGHEIIVEGYGRGDDFRGFGELLYEKIQSTLDEPCGVAFRDLSNERDLCFSYTDPLIFTANAYR